MTGAAGVLPFSEHLHGIVGGWPAQSASAPSLVKLSEAGKAIDEARRVASTVGYPRPNWPETEQPVGILYREAGVTSILQWLNGLAERLSGDERVLHAHAAIQSAANTSTPLLRLYQYAEEALEDINIIVSARKSFVFWDTDMLEGSCESLPDIRALWEIGAQLEPASGVAHADAPTAGIARLYERRVRDLPPDTPGLAQHIHQLDALVAEEARLAPIPSAGDAIPTRAEILWRPQRLELVDVERLRRWLTSKKDDARAGGALIDLSAFVESASREHADLLLDAFCTDSSEAL
jgi:hypothetical protein